MTDNRPLIAFSDRKEWRTWLESNHDKAADIWLVFYKKGTGKQAFSLADAVEEALCFGWIDGKLKSLDAERYSLRFCPRKANSIWSAGNIQRVEKLIQEGLMTEAGLAKVREAHQSGQWEAAFQRERTDLIPNDLEKALRSEKGALAGYTSLTGSRKKQLLHWLSIAKRPETRQKRIEAIVREVSG
jgi:uncharacterized protein YdeI (YjbR/CyaY-like superfamily)